LGKVIVDACGRYPAARWRGRWANIQTEAAFNKVFECLEQLF